MAIILSKILTDFLRILYKKTILLLIVFLCIGISLALFEMSELTIDLIESQALQSSVTTRFLLGQATDRKGDLIFALY